MQDAIQSESGRVMINLHVTPGASKDGFHGYDQWRKCIKVAVKGHPRKGEANAEVIELLSNWFGVRKSRIEIVSGGKDRLKTVSVRGLDKESVLRILKDMGEE